MSDNEPDGNNIQTGHLSILGVAHFIILVSNKQIKKKELNIKICVKPLQKLQFVVCSKNTNSKHIFCAY